MGWVRCGSVFMLLGVALGAFGAHGLKDVLSPEAKQTYQTAVFYQLVHGIGLLSVGWMSYLKTPSPLVRGAGWAFVVGILLFSGSLYAMSATGIKKFGIITPFGGLAFLIGWTFLAISAKGH